MQTNCFLAGNFFFGWNLRMIVKWGLTRWDFLLFIPHRSCEVTRSCRMKTKTKPMRPVRSNAVPMGSARHLIGRGAPFFSTTLHYPAIHLTARLDTTTIFQHGTTRYSTAQLPTACHYVPHHNSTQQTFLGTTPRLTSIHSSEQHETPPHNINSQPNGTNTKPNI